MRDQDIQRRLRIAVEHAAPDPLPRILASCAEQKGSVTSMEHETVSPREKRAPLFPRRRAAAVMAALVLIAACGFGWQSWNAVRSVASVVSLDVNPSIQLEVNSREEVLSAQPLNKDAWEILNGMDLKGTKLNVAVNAIVGSLLQHGYLSDIASAILISVEDRDPQRAVRLESSLNETVTAMLQNASGASVLTQVMTYDAGLEAQAQSSSVSVGMARLIQDVMDLNGNLAFEDLAGLTMEELRQLRDIGAPGLPIGTGAASYAAQEYAGVLEIDSVTADVDPELDEPAPYYEVELHMAGMGDFDYEVDAYSGRVLAGTPNLLSISAPASTPNTGTNQGQTANPPASPSVPNAGSYIGENRAKEIALERAKIAEEDTSYCSAWLEYDGGRPECYEVEFAVPGGWEYGYEIDLYTGTVLKSWTIEHRDAPASLGDTALDSAFAAWSIAFADAGVKEEDVTGLQSKTDWEDGVQVYEIEFRCNGTKYEYEISVQDGAILKREQEQDSHHTAASPRPAPAAPQDPTFIGEAAARQAALDHAGVSAGEARNFKCELDRDDGLCRYEIEFEVGRTEYEYEIDAVTGAVLKAETD